MVSEAPGAHYDFAWLPARAIAGRRRTGLRCHANSRVTYEVELTSTAVVMAWCAIGLDESRDPDETIEFEIRVRLGSGESHARCRTNGHGRWRLLRVKIAEAGPARITLTTRCVGHGRSCAASAIWGDPSIRWPRPFRDYGLGLRRAIAGHDIRGLWQRVLPLTEDQRYQIWAREHTPSRRVLRAQREWSTSRARLFTLISTVDDTDLRFIERSLASLLGQSYPKWEWILVAPEADLRRLAETSRGLAREPRVRLVPVPAETPRAGAWNSALGVGRGEHVAVLGASDMLSPDALYEMASGARSPARRRRGVLG